MANTWKIILRVGGDLNGAAKRAEGRNMQLPLPEREKVLETTKKGKFETVEEAFRQELLKRKLWDEISSLPEAVRPCEEEAQASSQAGASGPKPSAHCSDRAKQMVDLSAPDALTEVHVFGRLGINGLGEEVLARMGFERGPSEEGTSETRAREPRPVVKEEGAKGEVAAAQAGVQEVPAAQAGAQEVQWLAPTCGQRGWGQMAEARQRRVQDGPIAEVRAPKGAESECGAE